jgi:glucose-6-phosphate isomerase
MSSLYQRYGTYLCEVPTLDFQLDISRMRFDDDFLVRMEAPMQKAFADMAALEAGAVANPDEERRVGHYWLRDPARAPEPALTQAIERAIVQVTQFAADVHGGRVSPEKGPRFDRVLLIGIGGSALGPQLVADALGSARDRLAISFFDNTDPDGIDRVLQQIGEGLDRTLTVVISKSGGTKETRNGMLEAAAAYRARGLTFGRHAVAVTGDGSELDRHATAESWLQRFPMWDWVGGRTSVLSAVGLLPAALQGLEIEGLLTGARDMDAATRIPETRKNPAALLALMWHHATGGRGQKDMVVLPYKDRLLLFSRYLQQLVMESLGKEKDLAGRTVHQGLAVYGNKGSTDQHAYVQQLRDGVPNFFITFIQVLRDREGASLPVEPGATSGDFLLGFLLGTRKALYESGRESLTLTLPDVSARSLGGLIALYERAVGLYASLVNVNAYHQPGVEAGKKAAAAVLDLQHRLLARLASATTGAATAEELAKLVGTEEVEMVHSVLEHLAANDRVELEPGASRLQARYRRRG